MRITGIPFLVVFATVSILVAGCNNAAQTSEKPQLTASQQQQMKEQSRQAEITMRTEQIKSSNLPPEEKQRMIEQIRATAGK